jgi:hypothetical protein
MLLSQCDPTHPFRPSNWRHRLVEHCLQTGDGSLAISKDAATKRLYNFRKMLHRGGRYRERAMGKFSECYSALEIYHDRESDVRSILEARILSGAPIDIIAQKLGVQEKTVAAYVRNYFEVQTRLDCEDFIYGRVLRCSSSDGNMTEREMRLKQIAYRAGPSALDKILSRQSSASDKEQSNLNGTIELLKGLLWELANGSNASDELPKMQSIIKMLQQFSELAESDHPGISHDYKKHVAAFLKQMSWGIGRKKIPPELEGWMNTATELRADDMLRVTHGQSLVNEELLKSVKPPSELQEGEANTPPMTPQSD